MSRQFCAVSLKCLFFLVLLLVAGRPLLGQSSAAITGIVQDTADARIPNASIKLINTETGIESPSVTGKDGSFTIPSVLPGHYRLQIEREGFDTTQLAGITLNVGDNKAVIIRMKAGSSLQTVTVDGSGVNINTTDGSVSTVIDRQFVENLPLNGRSFQSLLYITPGVNLNVGGGTAVNQEGTVGQFVVNGQRGDANYWMVDGVSANFGMNPYQPGGGSGGAVGATNAVGGTNAMVSVDALQEFRIQTSTYAPEFGRAAGGQISIQTRSGTNQFHGTLFNFLRNGDLDAKDWFADNFGLAKPNEIQNDFGGVIGGPIVKDKTFFFFSAEGLRVIQPFTEVTTVPDLAARAAAIPAMQPYLNMYPVPAPGVPDTDPGSGLAPYTATFSNSAEANTFSLRLDHQLNTNLNFFARYSHAPSNFVQRGNGGNLPANDIVTESTVAKTATVGATWSKSAQVVNEARFNYSVGGGKELYNTDSFGGGTPFPGENLLPSPYSFGNTLVYYVSGVGTGMSVAMGFGAANYQHQYNVVDTLSVQKGAHSLKFGADYRRLTPNYGQAPLELLPVFFALSDMQQGNAYFITSHYAHGTLLMQNLGVFGQDTWRVNPRLNLTYGLRWDFDFVPSTQQGIPFPSLTGFSRTDLSHLGLAPSGTAPYGMRYGNIAPRFGGAYKISTDPDWGLVLRAGFGLFYGLASTEATNVTAIDGPLYPFGTNAYYPSVTFPTSPTDPEVQPPPVEAPNAANGNTLFGLDPHLNVPYALEWNVALEQSLGSAQTLSVSYIGASDKRLLTAESITNPNPNFASAYLISGTGTLSYAALQLEFQRRLRKGLQSLISYSWSHSIDDGSYGNYANGGFGNVNANRGDSDYDLRHVFTAAITYQPPALRTNWFTRALTSDWSLDDIAQLRTGPPLDVQDGNFSALSHDNASVFVRPDVVPGQPQYLTGSQYPGGKVLNPASFMDPPTELDPILGTLVPTRQGNLPRNGRRSLGLKQWDFAVHRDFPIHEAIKLQFRGELFNLLNHPNFAPFNNVFQTGNAFFGQSTQMLNQYLGGLAGGGQQNPLYTPGSPRSGELALKLIF
jgi:Carboxypeptidase regulatory-like domain